MTRARITFWALVAVSAVAISALTQALTAPATGTTVALSATVLAIALALALRILVKLEPTHRKDRP